MLSLAVSVQDKDAGRARDEANRRASAILEQLRALGLPEADVQAPSLTVNPTYDYGRGGPKVTGYQASRPISLRVRNIELLGPILDGLIDDGATQVHGTSMELAEPEAAIRQALGQAFAVARARAESLAEAAGVSLGAPLRVEETGEGGPMPLPRMGALRAVAEQAPTEVAAGEIEISGHVRVWFDIAG